MPLPFKKPRVKPHKSTKKYCAKCKRYHTINEHRFHGKQAHKKTHRKGI